MLIYHRVGGRTSSPVDLPLEVFTAQLDHLVELDRVVDLDTALRILQDPAADRGNGAPKVVLTFDDGTPDWADVALPELVARRLPATFYVATDFIEQHRAFPDDGQPISWAGLSEMASTGLATIGSHTHTHRVLANSDAATTDDELGRSRELIEDRLGVSCRHFAYPKAVAPSPAAETVVRRRYESATLAGNRPNHPGADVHRLGRHALTVADSQESFVRKVDGGQRLEGLLRERRDASRTARDGRDAG